MPRPVRSPAMPACIVPPYPGLGDGQRLQQQLHALGVILEKETNMTVQLYAQPYDISATGFYFETHDEYAEKAAALRNDHGDRVEEFEIQVIDGEAIDCDFARAIGLNQANLGQYLDAVDGWDTDEKTRVIIAVGDCGYDFSADTRPDDFDVVIYHLSSLRELAEHFVDEGLFGDIPERLQSYLDYDAIARDLGHDYSETEIGGQRLIYRCA